MLLEIWMAHRIFISGATFCVGDDRRHAHTALCDASKYIIPIVSV